MIKFLTFLLFSLPIFSTSHIDLLRKDFEKLQQEAIDKQNLLDSATIKLENLKSFQDHTQNQYQDTQKKSLDMLAQLYILSQLPLAIIMTSGDNSLEHLLALTTLKANLEYIQTQKLPLKLSTSQIQETLTGAHQEVIEIENQMNILKQNILSLEREIKKENSMSQALDHNISLSLEKGVLKRPVHGKIIPSDSKKYTKGIRFEVKSGEVVKSPIEGKVIFCGQFQSFGSLLIIEVSTRMNLVLAGMSEILVNLNQKIHPGEKVGIMPKSNLPTFLYLEIRQDGQATLPDIKFLD